MKKGITLFLLLFGCFVLSAQKKSSTEKAQDTVKTEVVNVVTSYTPTIADAFKIKKNPKIDLIKKSQKKKLKYTIFSAPVASTFIPKSGVVKGIDVGVKEHVYNNYIAAGFGNNTTPFFETFLRHSKRFEHDFGFYAKYISSENSIESTPLNSDYLNLNLGAYYKKEGGRYFDWEIGLNSERNEFNWYGLPALSFNDATINGIPEKQAYNYFELLGAVDVKDSFIKSGELAVSYYVDAFSTNESLLDLDAQFEFPLTDLNRKLNDIQIGASIEFLKGKFRQSYTDIDPVNYTIITAGVHPSYQFETSGFSIRTGLKAYISADTENSLTHFLIYPDVYISKPLIKDLFTVYGGASGDLHTNTYKQYVEENPYVSPTLFMTQTSEKLNAFFGFNGKFSSDISFNLRGSYKNEEDKPLFIRNNSKSDGTSNTLNGTTLQGYEYGNSFGVVYDDVKTIAVFGEIEIDLSKRITVGTTAQFDSFTLTDQSEAWNLPTTQATVFGKYKNNKWYAGATLFYVGERKDVLYSGTFPSGVSGTQSLGSYVDLNINGGYHFSDKFSAFLRLNNVLNNDYQRFANFNVQGFQVLGGLTYKFDF